MEILKTIYLTSWVLAVFVALGLMRRGRGNQSGNLTLAAFILFMALTPMVSYLRLSGLYLSYWMYIFPKISLMLIGPFAYFFVRVMLKRPIKFHIALIHLIPFIGLFFAHLFHINVEQLWVLFLVICISLTYGIANCSLLYMHRKQIKLLHKHYQNTAYYWLAFIVYGLFLLTLIKCYFLFMYHTTVIPTSNLWLFGELSLSFYILVIAGLSVLRPEVFYRETMVDDLPDEVASEDSNESSDHAQSDISASKESATETDEVNIQSQQEAPLNKEAAKNHELTESVSKELIIELTELMQTQKLELHNDLTLEKLATTMKISANQLSELLNTHMDTNFYQYINTKRLDAAVFMLKDKNCQLSILDIIFAAGFNNKNSFYKLFKTQMNTTPKQFRVDQMKEIVL